jgi:hypothetical protein
MNPTIPTLGQRVGVTWGFDGSGVEMRWTGQVVGFEADHLLVEVNHLVSNAPLREFDWFEHKGNRIAIVSLEKVSDAGQPARVASFGWAD